MRENPSKIVGEDRIDFGAIDPRVNEAHQWIERFREKFPWASSRDAVCALQVVLQEARDRFTLEEAIQFGNHLPTFVRGLYYAKWRTNDPQQEPPRDLGAQIKRVLSDRPEVDPDPIIQNAVELLSQYAHDSDDPTIKNSLSRICREFWPEATHSVFL